MQINDAGLFAWISLTALSWTYFIILISGDNNIGNSRNDFKYHNYCNNLSNLLFCYPDRIDISKNIVCRLAKHENTPTGRHAGERPNYMHEMTRMEASTIFKATTRMLDVKNNFRGKYNDTKLRRCTYTIESQEHVIETCIGIHDQPKTTAKQLTKILENDKTKKPSVATHVATQIYSTHLRSSSR